MATLNFKFLSDLSGLNKGVGKGKKALSGFEASTKKISRNIGRALGGIGLTIGVSALVGQLKEATLAAQDDILSQKQLARQLEITAGITGDAATAAESWITNLAKATGVADDKLRPALATALRVTGDYGKAQDLLNLSLDVSAGTGKDLETVTKSIGRAYLGNVTGLQRLVPGIKKTDDALGYLRKNFEGARETLADPFARFTVAIDEAQEKIGAILLPYVQEFAEYVIDVVAPAVESFIDDVSDPKTETGATFKRIADILGEIWQLITDIGKSESFKKVLEGALTLAETLLDVIENIANLLGTNAEAEKTKGSALSFTKGGKASVLSDANIQSAARQLGYTLEPYQIARARADLAGGADGNPMTPWPMAKGGVVMPRPGGTLARIGEAGRPEAVIPLDRFGALGGNTYVININKANVSGNEIVAAIQRYERGTGRRYLANG